MQGVNRVGERREEAGEEGVGVDEAPPRRLREENGYSFVEDGARKVSLDLRLLGVMGAEEGSSISDSPVSCPLSVIELALVGPSSVSELVDLR